MQINVNADLKSVEKALDNLKRLTKDKSQINAHITSMLRRRTKSVSYTHLTLPTKA